MSKARAGRSRAAQPQRLCEAGGAAGTGWTLILLALVTAQAALLRFAYLGHQSLWIDEAISVTHARGILENGFPLLPLGQVSWDSIPAHYLLAAGLVLFKDVHVGARFFPALAGVASVPVFYLLNLLVFRKRSQALLAAALLAMLTIDVAWSRQARYYAFVQLFEIAGLALLLRFLEVPKARTFWAGAGFLVLAVLCHPAAVWAVVAAAVAFGLPPRAISSRIAAALPWPRFRPLVAAALLVGVLAALKTSYHGVALQLLRPDAPGVGRWGMMYAGFLVVELGLFFVLFFAGAVAALGLRLRHAWALAAGAATYAAFISLRTPLFAFRYLMPVLPVVVAFAAHAVTLPIPVATAARWRRVAGACLAAMLLAGGVAWARLAYLPRGDYWLGYTEPQPDWRAGYAFIENDWKNIQDAGHSRGPCRIVSAFPFLDAEYLRGVPHSRYYLPISHTGLAGDVQWNPPYVPARVIGSLGELTRIGDAYVIMDDFALRMVADRQIQDYLTATGPTQRLSGRFGLSIWRLGGG